MAFSVRGSAPSVHPVASVPVVAACASTVVCVVDATSVCRSVHVPKIRLLMTAPGGVACLFSGLF